jgi:hypothetical protein
MGEMADGTLNDHWGWSGLPVTTTPRQWPHVIPWSMAQETEAAHLRICVQLDDSTLQSLRLVPSIHGASCEWSDTGKHYEATCSTQNQLVTYCDKHRSTNVGSVQQSDRYSACQTQLSMKEPTSLYKILLPVLYGLYTEYCLLFNICREVKRYSGIQY